MFTKRFVFLFLSLLLVGAVAGGSQAGEEKAGKDDVGLRAPVIQKEVRSILEKETMGLAELFRLAELTNPGIAAARNGVVAAEGRARQAGLYPNPALELSVDELSLEDPDDRKDKLTFVQPVVISGRRGAARDAARAEHEATAHALALTRREVFGRAHTLWVELLYFREADAELRELVRVANRTREIAQARFDLQAVPESQVAKALLEVYELELERQRFAEGRAKTSAELVALFGGLPLPFDRFDGKLELGRVQWNVKELTAELLETHPAILEAGQRVSAAESTLRVAEASRIPDLDLFVAYGRHRTLDEGFVEGGIAVPLPIFNRNQGRIAESRSLVARAEQNERSVLSDLTAELEVAYLRYLTASEQLHISHDQMEPTAERGMEQALEGYRAGRLPFLDLIDAQRTLADVRLRSLELMRALGTAEADLMSLVGRGPYAEQGGRR